MALNLVRPLHRPMSSCIVGACGWKGGPLPAPRSPLPDRNAGEPMNRPHGRLPKRQINRGLRGRGGDREPAGTRSNSGRIHLTSCYLMIYLSDTRLKIVDLKLQNGDSMLQIVNSKLRFVDSELQNPDSELQITDSELQNLDSELQNLDSKLQNVDSGLQNVDSRLREVDSKLQNHAKTADRDRHPGSAAAARTTRSTHRPFNRG
jgi:hypothetical protein